jgi:hypothetical protein
MGIPTLGAIQLIQISVGNIVQSINECQIMDVINGIEVISPTIPVQSLYQLTDPIISTHMIVITTETTGHRAVMIMAEMIIFQFRYRYRLQHLNHSGVNFYQTIVVNDQKILLERQNILNTIQMALV